MDLHFTNAVASEEEKSAVDSCIATFSLNGHRREFLLPVLHSIQDRMGWITEGALNYASKVLHVPPAETFGVADFYGLFSTTPRPPIVAHVCDDIACMAKGAHKLCAELENNIGPEGRSKDGKTTWHRSPCLGICERAPVALVIEAGSQPKDQSLVHVTASDIQNALSGKKLPDIKLSDSVPQIGQLGLKLLRNVGKISPESLDEYRAAGGFLALRRAIEMGAENVVREVTDSKLVGRGGAAFPTGLKWQSVRSQITPRYLICNADESEPGTFKDRVLMEGDPYTLIESMAIAAFATGCEHGYLYIRGEYPLATRRLEHAIKQCESRGFLGDNIMGDGVKFKLELRRGAGAYICGEETALMNSIEGKRGEPRNKPPFPSQSGLFGKPTVINNVETLMNVPIIILEGAKAYAATGTEKSTGPKLFCVSGHVVKPGVYEAPFGITLRQVLDMAGGVTGKLQACLLGGAAGAFLGPTELDVPLTFEGTRAIGATLGSAVVMPFNETTDLGKILHRIAGFFRDESCGQCVPCRVGTVRQEELLQRLSNDKAHGSIKQELFVLKEVGQVMRDASICGLGQTASSAVESALAKFPIFLEKR